MKTKNTTTKRKQKQFQSSEKAAIIRQHLLDKRVISDLCDEHGIHPSVYYRWQKQFFEGGEKAFAPTNEARVVTQLKQKVDQLESKLTRKDEVLGELMEEYVTLKKAVGTVNQAVG
jgi:transposase-like protein